MTERICLLLLCCIVVNITFRTRNLTKPRRDHCTSK